MLVHYLATSPSLFAPIAQNLSIAGLAGPQARIVLEKPLGHSLDSARAINQSIGTGCSTSRGCSASTTTWARKPCRT